MPPHSPPPIRVFAAGAALTLSAVACAGQGPASPVDPAPPEPPRTTNPPPPELPRTANPPPPADVEAGATAGDLPRWDDVESGHPPGATNPPLPVLEVTADGTRCFKAWQSPMVRDPDLLAVGGRVLASADAAQGTEVVCEPDKAAALLRRHAKAEAAGTPPGPARSGE